MNRWMSVPLRHIYSLPVWNYIIISNTIDQTQSMVGWLAIICITQQREFKQKVWWFIYFAAQSSSWILTIYILFERVRKIKWINVSYYWRVHFSYKDNRKPYFQYLFRLKKFLFIIKCIDNLSNFYHFASFSIQWIMMKFRNIWKINFSYFISWCHWPCIVLDGSDQFILFSPI